MALLDDLKVFYDLATDANDDHNVGPYNLTSVGTPAFSGGFAVLEGNTDYFHVASNADLVAGGTFSVTAWVKLPSIGDFAIILCKWGATSGTNQEWQIRFSSSLTRFQMIIRDTAENLVQADADNFGAPSINTEYFVAGGYDSVSEVVWVAINAGTPNTTASVNDVDSGTYRLEVGAGIEILGLGSNQSLRRVGFWKRDIRSDLSTLYNAGSGMDYAAMSGGGGGGNRRRRFFLGAA